MRIGGAQTLDSPAQERRRLVQALAKRQSGVVSHCQLRELGVSQKTIEYWIGTGMLIRLHAGVYALGHDSLTQRGRFVAALLACGPGAALSHRSAAQHWGLLSVDQRLIDVTAARSRKQTKGVRLHRPTRIGEEDFTSFSGLAVTTVGRTLVDLAGCVPYGVTERAWRQAEFLRILDLDEVQGAIERAGKKRGRRKIEQLLLTADPMRASGPNEGNEELLLRALQFGCPVKPEVNVYVDDLKVDFFFRRQRLIVETDGSQAHYTSGAFQRDRERDRVQQLAGYRVLRFTTSDLRYRMRAVLDDINVALANSAALSNPI